MLNRLVRGRRPMLWLAVALSACSTDRLSAPTLSPSGDASLTVTASGSDVVISQIYGGGGNSGATLKHDFIELHNRSSLPVSVAGWSVQYASATGTTWQATALSGTIQPGAYHLVREAQGAGGTVDLPTPDAIGSIPMSATAGKVALSTTATLFTTACPTGTPAAIDLVSFGTGATDCLFGKTATLSNTTATLRLDGGCTYTGNAQADFATGAPAPRNSASPTRTCGTVLPPSVGPFHHVTVSGSATVTEGSTTTLTAFAEDAENDRIAGATFTWESSDANLATVDQNTGVVTGVTAGGPVGITATTTIDGETKSRTHQITVQAPAGGSFFISGRVPSDPPIPVGFQDQLFAIRGNTTIPATWVSLNTSIATIDGRGVITAITPGNATFRATVSDGSTRTTTLAMEAGTTGNAALYGNHVLFGAPTVGGSDSDLRVTRDQYSLSYNKSRGGPNWIAYRLTKENRGNLPGYRCDCFATDPAVTAADEVGLTTADYTGSGFDRGHMVRSNDRELGTRDQAATYYLSNIVPQWADQNQGRWGDLENYLQTVAEGAGLPDVYIITGGRGEASRIAGGRIAVPTHTWKVALVVKTGASLASIDDPSDILDVIAVDMPNVDNLPRDGNWQAHRVTVDAVEAATGYDVLAMLTDYVETIVESGDRRPTASYTGTTSGVEGVTLNFTSSSTDADIGTSLNDFLSYQWSVNGTPKSIESSIIATFPDDGAYMVQLIVSDKFGWADTTTKTVTIANVNPEVGSFAGATILRGESYESSGAFTDPGADSWTATVNYGDGSATQPLALSGESFSLAHQYATAGTFIVTVTVQDDDLGTGTRTATVIVVSAEAAIGTLSDKVTAMAAAGTLSKGEANALDASLRNALKSLDKDNPTPARNQLEAFINKVEAMERSGRLTAANANALIAYAQRIVASIM